MPLLLADLSVLVTDENPHMRQLVKNILWSFGIKKIHEATDGSEAILELRNGAFDLVITDSEMQPVDGVDLTRLLRTAPDSPNHYIPIIMLTAHTERHRVFEMRDAGITELLAKPVSPLGLYKRIEAIVFNERPFVRAEKYTGPCRRRADRPLEGMTDRRTTAVTVAA